MDYALVQTHSGTAQSLWLPSWLTRYGMSDPTTVHLTLALPVPLTLIQDLVQQHVLASLARSSPNGLTRHHQGVAHGTPEIPHHPTGTEETSTPGVVAPTGVP
jgi:hypothetical protein